MKNGDNKGFSLVELIIVIAIMASAMHVLDAGTLTADTLDSIPYVIIMSVVTLCGLFVT